MSSKAERKSKRKRKRIAYSLSQKNKLFGKTLDVSKTDDDFDIKDTSIYVKLKSQSSDLDENSNKLFRDNIDAAHSAEISNHAKKIAVEDKPSLACSSEYSNISLNIVKEKLNCSSETETDDICQILSGHSIQFLKNVIEHGIDYMKLCGRTNFLVDDFYRGLYVSREWDFNEPYLIAKKLDAFNNSFIEHKNPSYEGEWLENNNLVSGGTPNIPVELQAYFIEVTKVLLKEDGEELCSAVCQNLETNSSLIKLVPYFVKFLSECIDSLSCDFLKVTRLLWAMQSLLFNSHLYFFHDSDLTSLASTLLRFLFLDLPHSSENIDCWCLKDYAAYLLKQVLKKSKSIALMSMILNKIESYFSEFSSHSFISQYGAIVSVNSIGVIAILWLMPSHLDKCFEYINLIYSNHERYQICMVKGQLVRSYYILMRHYFRYEFDQTKETKYFPTFLKDRVFPLLSQSNFVEYFGDTLVQHFPQPNFISFNVSLKKKLSVVKSKKQFNRFYLKGNNIKKETHKKPLLSREKIFDIIPIKRHTIKFSKINIKNFNVSTMNIEKNSL